MNVCVTGGAGYIGSHLVAALVGNGHDVTIVDSLENGTRVHPKCRFFSHDIREIDQIERELMGTEVFFHLAADKRATSKDYYEMISVNVGGTTAVLETAKKIGAKRFVLSSSAAVYSKAASKHGSCFEGDASSDKKPENVYGLSKMMAEDVAKFMEDEDFTVVCLRYFNVFGGEYTPNAVVKSAVEHFMNAMSKGLPIKIYGDGSAVRDFIHVDDVVDANLLAMTYTQQTSQRAFNVCTGMGTSILELARLVCGKDYPITFEPSREEIAHSVGGTKLAEYGLGFKAKRSIRELAAAHT
jgi:UDP-glucose 4-epimerase